ncbi:FecCD family ABC transporter permease [Robiginitomaculum antarcticum]|uniref:FecCD family ABC transporter permease n=1 Tax=Robiginitomaculum antarcticum TaxID=437507 RepID=UPI00037D3274|nr:iron ABC transporter permease [Robiginitomaculum antarcticum]
MKLLWLIICVIGITFASLLIGSADIKPLAALYALLGQGEPAHVLIMQQLRVPRAVLGLAIGAGLGASGAALQGYSRNPLADPGILGFSACAALGAVTALYFGLRAYVPLFALLGAGLGAALLLIWVRQRQRASVLILAGVGLGALATALTGLIMNFAPNPWALSEIVYWMMGSLREAGPSALLYCLPLTAIGLILLFITAPDLRALALGEDTAQSLGVSLPRLQILLVTGVAFCVGSGVAAAGAIGFVGLFIPHILRALIGADPARLVPTSALAGGGFLVLADIATRAISSNGATLYLGILTSLIGVPFFLWLATRKMPS